MEASSLTLSALKLTSAPLTCEAGASKKLSFRGNMSSPAGHGIFGTSSVIHRTKLAYQEKGPHRSAYRVFHSAKIHSSARASTVTVDESELDLVKKFSEIVPDTVVGDDFERFAPTAATVTSSLILGISSLPEAKYDAAIESALAYDKCLIERSGTVQKMSCFLDKALVNVGAELTKVVPGRVSTEVDPRISHNTAAIVDKVRFLLRLYKEVGVSSDRLLFKIPATWQGIWAARELEDDGIQTHLTSVDSFAQAAACVQASVSVIQISVGRIRDWARSNSGDSNIDAAVSAGEDPAITTVSKVLKLIKKNKLKTKVMASNIRSREDVLSLLGVDYIIVPLKVLESLQSTPAPSSLPHPLITSTDNDDLPSMSELGSWTEEKFLTLMGPSGKQLLDADINSAISQTNRVEEYFSRIWPPPNV